MSFMGVFTVIKTAFDADSALSSALRNGLHAHEAREGKLPPYGVYQHTGNVPFKTAGGQMLEAPRIQFLLFSKTTDATEITTMYNALIAVYDPLLTQTGGYSYLFNRIADLISRVGGEFQAMVEYIVDITPS
jgi:hypothetical protein